MPWTQEQIKDHKKAAEFLAHIINNSFSWIKDKSSITEYQLMRYLLTQLKKHSLKTDRNHLIAAFNQSSAMPHYYPKKISSRKLFPDSLILIDIWAKLNKKTAPFADITWIAWYGNKIPSNIQNLFDLVIKARDNGIKLIEKRLKNKGIPTGREIDKEVYHIIKEKGYEKNILHRTGHSIGTTSPHGNKARVRFSNKNPLIPNLGYTIEPGIYFKDKFGLRSEIDLYISEEYKLVITTKAQKEIVKIS